ncbi:MAG TPA: type IV secretion system protein, partial [Clostridiales bacterium]|nr:type IV secretion system protein [Clostridiales bacterium]
ILDLTHHVWGMLGDCLNNNGAFNNGVDNIENMAKDYSYIFRLFAYSLIVLLFGINVIENALKYELFSMKGAVGVLGKLFLSKVWIDLSVPICFEVIKIADSMTSAIVKMGIHNLTFNPPLTVLDVSFKGNFGEVIVAFLLELIMIVPLVLMSLLVTILAICILVKLGIRTIELCLMVIVSPLFFACLIADTTRPIFKRFIMNFITSSFQTVFMSVVYIIGIEWMQQYASASETDLALWILGSLNWIIILFAMTIMMIKPPKVLTNIINS